MKKILASLFILVLLSIPGCLKKDEEAPIIFNQTVCTDNLCIEFESRFDGSQIILTIAGENKFPSDIYNLEAMVIRGLHIDPVKRRDNPAADYVSLVNYLAKESSFDRELFIPVENPRAIKSTQTDNLLVRTKYNVKELRFPSPTIVISEPTARIDPNFDEMTEKKTYAGVTVESVMNPYKLKVGNSHRIKYEIKIYKEKKLPEGNQGIFSETIPNLTIKIKFGNRLILTDCYLYPHQAKECKPVSLEKDHERSQGYIVFHNLVFDAKEKLLKITMFFEIDPLHGLKFEPGFGLPTSVILNDVPIYQDATVFVSYFYEK
jgi:hypothetical protein